MGSNKGKGRERGPERRRRSTPKRVNPLMEALEQRALMAGPNDNPPSILPTPADLQQIKSGDFAKAGQHLYDIFNGVRYPQIRIEGDFVGIDARTNGDLNAYAQKLVALGMQIEAVDVPTRTIEGLLPINQIRAAAILPETGVMAPIYYPIRFQQGVANNQAEQALLADAARLQFNVDGTGIVVGVLSDSADQFDDPNRAGTGLAESIASGDLPPLSRIQVLDDTAPGQNVDEGRAMMEHIFDIAPGANLAFHTAFTGDIQFAQGIRNLSRLANAQVIVDDIGYANDPFYQDGRLGQAVIDVVRNDNRIYFSAAANSADHGFESPFREATATIAGNSGRFMDFDPGPGVLTQLPITVASPGNIVFMYDQPFYTANGVVSDVDFFALDAGGNIVASGQTNNINGDPFEFVAGVPTTATSVAIFVRSGPSPGRVHFREFGGDINPSKQFGSAGEITYGTTFGLRTANEAIGVGAVPWFNVLPPGPISPIRNEDFSSFGPVKIVFDPAGNRLPQVQTRLKPDISAIDAANTTFFPPGGDIPQDPDTFPNFFGTSAAAPNLAAVAALMRQLAPGVTADDVRNAFIASAIPLNGSPKGAWDVQGGFGLAQAPAALQAVDRLRVQLTVPAVGQTLGTAPQAITFVFSRPIDPSTLQASDLVFTSLPPNVQVVIGTPVFDPANPTLVAFPLTFLPTGGATANGTYSYTLAEASVASTDGRPVVAFTGSFAISDFNSPRVVNTQFVGRAVVAQFSEPMRPDLINKSTVLLVRTGGAGVFGDPRNVIVTGDPRTVVFYDAPNNRVIIDLTQLPQEALPSDTYALVILDTVTDIVGNRLDGEFNGVFPSGNTQPGGNFVQALFNQALRAPQIAAIRLDPGDPLANPPRPTSDTGIPGDQNTRASQPTFVGQVTSDFPGSVSGVTVAVQFNALHGGTFDLRTGAGSPPRGFAGTPDVIAVTDASGRFTFTAPVPLQDGFHTVRIVIVGQPDSPPLPGFSTLLDTSFRIDTTTPLFSGASIAQDTRINSLTSGISLFAVDPVAPFSLTDPLAVPTQFSVPALDPATATNINNYSLYNLGPDRQLGTADDREFSTAIISAVYTDTTRRLQTNDFYTGRVDLTFGAGLPAGRYLLVARTPQPGFQGIVDAAGNPLDSDPNFPGLQNFGLFFDLQSEPVFITRLAARSPDANGGPGIVESGPRSFYELPVPGFAPRANNAPTEFYIDFSNPIAPSGGGALVPGPFNPDAVQLIRSADTAGSAPDGDFGDLGLASGFGTGFSRVPGVSVRLENSNPAAQGLGDPGFLNRLIVSLAPGTTLAADFYRLYLPNTGTNVIRDVFGNELDGEFLGNPDPLTGNSRNAPGFLAAPIQYETLLPNGQTRPGLSGDTVAGGAFMTGYVVAPGQTFVNGVLQGNIIYARPDYIDDPTLTSDDPDGSLARPFPALAPEAVPNQLNGGDLNSSLNFGTNFDTRLDRNGSLRRNSTRGFDRSALFAAQVASARGPVVVVALPAATNPVETFVIQAPSGTDPLFNDASVNVPTNTLLTFAPGSSLKLQNASVFTQYQGSALQALGGPNPENRVTFTSYADDTIGGDTNADGGATTGGRTPRGGDWGGLTFRNYDDVSSGGRIVPVAPGPRDPNRPRLGRSGADDALSSLNFSRVFYAGGAVPQTIGFRYDAITLFNSRPAITNSDISIFNVNLADPNSSSQAAISGDLDSFREDDTARGPLIRRTRTFNSSINGILLRAELDGTIHQTDAKTYPDNPRTLGGTRNFTLDDPLPHVQVARMAIGEEFLQTGGGALRPTANRLFIQPGMLLKFNRGAAIFVDTQGVGASVNVGDRTYIRGFDADPAYSPDSANFRPNSVGDARVLFTSLADDLATTFFFDPNTRVATTIVPPLDSDNNGSIRQPTPGSVDPLVRWGALIVNAPGVATIDESEFRFGGGTVNVPGGTTSARVLNFGGTGTRASVTNNDFFDNADAPIGIQPNGLLAADPLRPLQLGNPFFRNNVFLRNGVDGLGVFPPDPDPEPSFPNLTVDSIWDDTDLTYVLRDTILVGPFGFAGLLPQPDPNNFQAERRPGVTLTIQSSLPDSRLADGSRIARPGESAVVKLLGGAPLAASLFDTPNQTSNNNVDDEGGAGFLVGFDNGVDPPADTLIDSGQSAQIRITGIPGNETTGQQRVPVIITSLRDDTVGRTVRGVDQFDTTPTDGNDPSAGDGGVIGFGGLSLSDYNLYDPRGGNLIDNADIRFISRIQVQGGGFHDVADIVAPQGLGPEDFVAGQKAGVGGGFFGSAGIPLLQNNATKAIAFSNNNFSSFRDYGILQHPGFNILIRDVGPLGGFPSLMLNPAIQRSGFRGAATNVFALNNTFSNMPTAVRVVGEPSVDNVAGQQQVTEFVGLHNTFANNGIGLHVEAIPFAPPTSLSHVHLVLMNNIFANHTTSGVETVGDVRGSLGQYNLYFNNNNQNVVDLPTSTGFAAFDAQQILGDPMFRNAAAGDFSLLPGSVAIDAARSELSLSATTSGSSITTLRTISDQVFDTFGTGGIRNDTVRLPDFAPFDPRDILALPGFPIRQFDDDPEPEFDQFIPAIPGTPGAFNGTASDNGASYWYMPIGGERDALGFLRQDNPGTSNLGAGSRPFFDIGAREFRLITPPRITGVTAVVTDPSTPAGVRPINLYAINGVAGTNRTPRVIQVQFDRRLDPDTVNNTTILLDTSGGDGIFGNANSSAERRIDLSGKLSYDPASGLVTVDLVSSNVVLGSDLYRITVLGSGGNVVRDPQGIALDGENTVGGQPNGAQLPLPSGDGVPGGNFFVTFSIDTTAPQVDPSVRVALAAASDSNRPDNITNSANPSFTGQVLDVFPPRNPTVGQTVVVQVLDQTTGIFVTRGSAVTGANGQFTVAVTGPPLPDSNYSVGPDGLLGTPDDTGQSLARILVVDQSGNISDLNDPNAFVSFIVDTRGPRVTGADPLPNSQANVTVAPDGSRRVMVTLSVSENLDEQRLRSGGIVARRAGGDGVFGNANDVGLTIDLASLRTQYFPFTGAGRITFDVVGVTANDVYRVTLVGSGANPAIDIAGNAIDGDLDGTPGGDFNLDFVVFDPSFTNIIFVQAGTANPNADGSRANPFTSIDGQTLPGPDGQLGTADDVAVPGGIDAAGPGDIVAVLPGVYNEEIQLRSLVRLLSASTSSTDTSFVPGLALNTIIRPLRTGVSAVSGNNLVSIPSVNTEIAGFTITSPLSTTAGTGPIVAGSVGVNLFNSDVLVSKNYIITSQFGIIAGFGGVGAPTPRIESNGIIGNTVGLVINDTGAQSLEDGLPVRVANNTIAFNTFGVFLNVAGPVQTLGDLVNNIFFENASVPTRNSGAAINATAPGRLIVRNNLFANNGPSRTSVADETIGVGGGFNPSNLGSGLDQFGNYPANPSFVRPIDPRPESSGPNNFFAAPGASFDLNSNSGAIDNALNSAAPAQDFLYRSRVDIPGVGRQAPGIGPADVGAFERNGTPFNGTFATAFGVQASTFGASSAPRAFGVSSVAATDLAVTFNGTVDPATVQATDVVLTGDGLDPNDPAHVATVTIEGSRVRFGLAGRLRPSGNIRVAIPDGVIADLAGTPLDGYTDEVTVPDAPAAAPTSPTATGGSAVPLPTSTTPVVTTTAIGSPTPAPPTSPRRLRGLFRRRR